MKTTPSSSFTSSPVSVSYHSNTLTPRKIGFGFAGFFIISFLVLFYPFSQFFRGSWEARPYVSFFTTNDIKAKLPDWQNNGTLKSIFEFLTQNQIEWFGFRFYSMFLFIGAVIGFFLMTYFLGLKSVAETTVEKIFVTFILLGIIGARGLFVLLNLEVFTKNPDKILNFQGGGFSVFGAFALCGAYLVWYCNKYKFNLWGFLSALVPSVLIVQIFARFGNFFNYESYGKPTSVPWKMFVPEGAVFANLYPVGNVIERFYHPTFLYEALINSTLLILVLLNYSKLEKKKEGLVFAIYAIVYGMTRICMDFLRLDMQTFIKFGAIDIHFAQIFGFILLVLGLHTLLKKKTD
jgi:phosphatidylglycerol---prolipoprotein diacylglyceryl transferase